MNSLDFVKLKKLKGCRCERSNRAGFTLRWLSFPVNNNDTFSLQLHPLMFYPLPLFVFKTLDGYKCLGAFGEIVARLSFLFKAFGIRCC